MKAREIWSGLRVFLREMGAAGFLSIGDNEDFLEVTVYGTAVKVQLNHPPIM